MTNKLIARCIAVACAGEYGYVSGVIQGKRLHKEAVTHSFIHQSFNHLEARVLKDLHDALCDVPK